MTQASKIMSAPMGMAENFFSFCRLFMNYFRRTRPLENAFIGFLSSIKDFLMLKQKLKIAQYRVNHLRYRVNQMEKIIEQSNPETSISGSILNQLR